MNHPFVNELTMNFFVLEEIKTLVATAASKRRCLVKHTKVHGTLLVCSFHQIILIIRKLFGETRTAQKNERKSQDFLRVKISRFTAVSDKT